MNQHRLILSVTLVVLGLSSLAQAERRPGFVRRPGVSSNDRGGDRGPGPGGPGGPGGFGGGPGGGPGGPGGRHLTPAQEQAFQSCMQQKGIEPPSHPQLTDAQRAALDTCKGQSQDREAFHQCAEAAGVPKPSRPDSSTMDALRVCRDTALSAADTSNNQ